MPVTCSLIELTNVQNVLIRTKYISERTGSSPLTSTLFSHTPVTWPLSEVVSRKVLLLQLLELVQPSNFKDIYFHVKVSAFCLPRWHISTTGSNLTICCPPAPSADVWIWSYTCATCKGGLSPFTWIPGGISSAWSLFAPWLRMTISSCGPRWDR